MDHLYHSNAFALSSAYDKETYTVIEEFLLQYTNQNTQKAYHSILCSYFQALRVRSLQEMAVFLKDFPAACQQTSEFLLLGSPNTVRQKTSCLNSFYKWFLKLYRLDPSLHPVVVPKLPQSARRAKTQSLPEEELWQQLTELRNQAANSYLDHLAYALSLLLATTSVRISEALQVTTTMVGEGVIYFIQKRGEEREIDLPGFVQESLSEFMQQHDLQGYLFQTEGKRKERQRLSRHQAYKLLKQKTGIGCHGFRKSAIEILLNEKVHPSEIVKVTGHSSLEMVNYYDGRRRKAQEQHRLAEKLQKKSTSQ